MDSETLCVLDLFTHAGNVVSAMGRSIYNYKDYGLGSCTKTHKVTEWMAQVHQGYEQVGGTTGTGVFWPYLVPWLTFLVQTPNHLEL